MSAWVRKIKGIQMGRVTADPIVETKDLTIRFGGHVAVDKVNLRVEPFAMKSIIGPNGGGKDHPV